MNRSDHMHRNDVTLQILQDRRWQAREAGDMIASDAYDLLIGHLIGMVEIYAPLNRTLEVARESEKARVTA